MAKITNDIKNIVEQTRVHEIEKILTRMNVADFKVDEFAGIMFVTLGDFSKLPKILDNIAPHKQVRVSSTKGGIKLEFHA